MPSKFDTEKLRGLIGDFYTLTGIKTAVFDTDFSKIVACPEEDCGYCALMDAAACARCDREACKSAREMGGIYFYTCHAGLSEVVVPIRVQMVTLGYIIFGQLRRAEDGEAGRARAIAGCRAQGIDEAVAAREYDAAVCRSEAEIRAAAGIMESCACYMWYSRQVSLSENSPLRQLTAYINDNLASDLSVASLCAALELSRDALYAITREALGIGVAAYIRKTRLSAAMRLLEQGAPVYKAAESVGFGDYNYFSKIFRRETGVTPSAYKRRGSAD